MVYQVLVPGTRYQVTSNALLKYYQYCSSTGTTTTTTSSRNTSSTSSSFASYSEYYRDSSGGTGKITDDGYYCKRHVLLY